MSQPIWITTSGFLGNFPSTPPIEIELKAEPVYPALRITYTKLNGTFPEGVTLKTVNNVCVISGDLSGVDSPTNFKFTVRATDEVGNIADRTFNFTLLTAEAPTFVRFSGNLISVVDSFYVDYKIQYETNVPNLTGKFFISSGELPPGLFLNEDTGVISGYPAAPITLNGEPTVKYYTFTLNFASVLGSIYTTYIITVNNIQLTASYPNPRFPVILNYKPFAIPLNQSDPYYSYYLIDGKKIPVLKSGDFFSFKVIGYDFDGGTLTYNYEGLPPGLIGDTKTGWITGVVNIGIGLSEYVFNVHLTKNSNGLMSEIVEFSLIVSNEIVNDIEWISPTNLGTVYNNSISTLKLEASSTQNLQYKLLSGALPPTLTLNSNGEIQGRIPFQPIDKLSVTGTTNTFEFTVEAFTPQYPLVKSQKTFNLSIYQYFAEVTENVYMKASPPISERELINQLLNDTTLIPDEYIYRPSDENFGKAKNISFVHAYGIKANNIDKYIEAIQKNHYWRNLTLGELKTAIARDDDGNIIYEVVYSQIVDDYINDKNKSISEEIQWPTYVSEELGPWLTSEGFLYTSFSDLSFPLPENQNVDFFTSLTPGSERYFYPASLPNMKKRIEQNLGVDSNSNLLPKWMTTQQLNESVIGYTRAWVICYTVPGRSEEIANNIKNNWPHKLNNISFVVNRFYVDKSSTFNYNTYLSIPGWQELPSGYPKPNKTDENDLVITFPQKTIIP